MISDKKNCISLRYIESGGYSTFLYNYISELKILYPELWKSSNNVCIKHIKNFRKMSYNEKNNIRHSVFINIILLIIVLNFPKSWLN